MKEKGNYEEQSLRSSSKRNPINTMDSAYDGAEFAAPAGEIFDESAVNYDQQQLYDSNNHDQYQAAGQNEHHYGTDGCGDQYETQGAEYNDQAPASNNGDWVQCYDEESGYPYVYNTVTGETKWIDADTTNNLMVTIWEKYYDEQGYEYYYDPVSISSIFRIFALDWCYCEFLFVFFFVISIHLRRPLASRGGSCRKMLFLVTVKKASLTEPTSTTMSSTLQIPNLLRPLSRRVNKRLCPAAGLGQSRVCLRDSLKFRLHQHLVNRLRLLQCIRWPRRPLWKV